VAIALNNLGQALFAHRDLEGALMCTQRTLKIDERVYGPNHRVVAEVANNMGVISEAKGDFEGAHNYFR
jgi:hypothetical protein